MWFGRGLFFFLFLFCWIFFLWLCLWLCGFCVDWIWVVIVFVGYGIGFMLYGSFYCWFFGFVLWFLVFCCEVMNMEICSVCLGFGDIFGLLVMVVLYLYIWFNIVCMWCVIDFCEIFYVLFWYDFVLIREKWIWDILFVVVFGCWFCDLYLLGFRGWWIFF